MLGKFLYTEFGEGSSLCPAKSTGLFWMQEWVHRYMAELRVDLALKTSRWGENKIDKTDSMLQAFMQSTSSQCAMCRKFIARDVQLYLESLRKAIQKKQAEVRGMS